MVEIEVVKQNFEAEVLKSDIPVIVDFWASWCGPCRMLAPIITEIAEENIGKIKVCKINVDKQPYIANKFGVVSIPTVVGFKNGEVTGKVIGYRPKEDILSVIK